MRSPADYPNADTHRDSLRRALHHRFVDADGTRQQVFEIKVGVVSTLGERLSQVAFQVLLVILKREAKIDCENCILQATIAPRARAVPMPVWLSSGFALQAYISPFVRCVMMQ